LSRKTKSSKRSWFSLTIRLSALNKLSTLQLLRVSGNLKEKQHHLLLRFMEKLLKSTMLFFRKRRITLLE